MLRVNIEVTESSTRLKQIHEVVVVNRGEPGQEWLVPYDVFLDGQVEVGVVHNRGDGALRLVGAALAALEEVGIGTSENA